MRHQTLFFISLFSGSLILSAQPYFEKRELEVQPNLVIPIESEKQITGVIIQGTEEIESASLHLDDELIPFNEDPHALRRHQSGIIHISTESTLSLLTGRMEGMISVVLLFAGSYDGDRIPKRIKRDPCELPEIVSQPAWRSGLPEPDYNKSFASTNHVIVHHSAGSNTVDDYYLEVRNIYIYHTEFNGWSDIGYNYLISPDGTIFAGRDPGLGDQDQVVGAHFCGKNTGTMGICVMGNYEEINPVSSSLKALENLIAWKMKSDKLSPFNTSIHVGEELETLAGHRDGCSTLCPGKFLYQELAQIKNNVASQLSECGQAIPAPFILSFQSFDTLIFEGGFINFRLTDYSESISYSWVFEGGQPARYEGSNPPSIRYPSSGDYDVTLIGTNGFIIDTLAVRDYVHVMESNGIPKIGNSLVNSQYIDIIHDQQIGFSDAYLYDLQGRLYQFKVERINSTTSRVKLNSALSNGTYVLAIGQADYDWRFRLFILN